MEKITAKALAEKYLSLQHVGLGSNTDIATLKKLLAKSHISYHFKELIIFDAQRRDGWGSLKAVLKTAKEDFGINLEAQKYGIFGDPAEAFLTEITFFKKSQTFLQYQQSPKGWLDIPISLQLWQNYLKRKERRLTKNIIQLNYGK